MSASFVSIAVHLFIVSIATTPLPAGVARLSIPYTKSFNLSRSVW